VPITTVERESLTRLPLEDAMKKMVLSTLAVLMIVAGMVLSGCGGGSSSDAPPARSGTVEGNAK